jgi:ankyrin repeat protein
VNAKAKVSEITDRRHGDFPTGGFTPLMWAVRNGHDDVARELVKKGADLKATNGDNLTATMIAIINDRFDLASELIDLGSDPNDGSLYFAVDLHDGTTDMRARDGGLLRWDHPNKLTALDLIKKLLDKGADPNKPFNGQTHSWGLGNGETHNGTPFYRAAVASVVEARKVLIAKGADMSWIPTAGGRGGSPRPAFIATAVGGRGYNFGGGPGFGRPGEPVWREPGSRKPLDAVKVMLDAGADPNVQLDDDGNTALHQAAQRNDLEMIRVLVAGKANLESYNWTGQTPLNIAEDNYEKSKDPNAPPDPAVLAAMQAGTAVEKAKATPYQTVQLFRELLGWPALPPDSTPAAKPATTTASANQGN